MTSGSEGGRRAEPDGKPDGVAILDRQRLSPIFSTYDVDGQTCRRAVSVTHSAVLDQPSEKNCTRMLILMLMASYLIGPCCQCHSTGFPSRSIPTKVWGPPLEEGPVPNSANQMSAHHTVTERVTGTQHRVCDGAGNTWQEACCGVTRV